MVSPIEQRYIDLHPGSVERHAAARDIFPDGVTHDGRRMSPFPIYATHGIGLTSGTWTATVSSTTGPATGR